MQASRPIRSGDMLYLDYTGKVAPIGTARQTYTPLERFVRWTGRLLHSTRLAQYHNQWWIGVAADDAQKDDVVTVIVSGVFGVPPKRRTLAGCWRASRLRRFLTAR